MSGHGLTYSLTMCYTNFTGSKFVAISIFIQKSNKIAFSLEFFSLCKKEKRIKKNKIPAITSETYSNSLMLSTIDASTLSSEMKEET
jgi:hypothetical protein